MAELRSNDILSIQDTKNKKIDSGLAELEEELTNVDARLKNLEFIKRINITQWYQYQNTEWYYYATSEYADIKKTFDAIYKLSNCEYVFQFYLRSANTQWTCTKIEYSNSEYYFYFGETILRMQLYTNMFLINRSDVGSCQFIFHYSLL